MDFGLLSLCSNCTWPPSSGDVASVGPPERKRHRSSKRGRSLSVTKDLLLWHGRLQLSWTTLTTSWPECTFICWCISRILVISSEWPPFFKEWYPLWYHGRTDSQWDRLVFVLISFCGQGWISLGRICPCQSSWRGWGPSQYSGPRYSQQGSIG